MPFGVAFAAATAAIGVKNVLMIFFILLGTILAPENQNSAGSAVSIILTYLLLNWVSIEKHSKYYITSVIVMAVVLVVKCCL